jgi:hypothetical protein
MRRTNALYSSFSTRRRGRFDVNPALTVSCLPTWPVGDRLAAWLTRCRGGVQAQSCSKRSKFVPSLRRERALLIELITGCVDQSVGVAASVAARSTSPSSRVEGHSRDRSLGVPAP